MEGKQKINCTVESCKYNNVNKRQCNLNSIMVAPTMKNNSRETDESMCSSYES